MPDPASIGRVAVAWRIVADVPARTASLVV